MAGTSQWWLSTITPSFTGSRWFGIYHGNARNSDATVDTQTFAEAPVAASGNLLTLKVTLSAAPGTGKSWRIQVVINGTANTTLDVTIADAATTGTATGTVAITAGDTISLKLVSSGAVSTSIRIFASTEFMPTTDNQYFYPVHMFQNAVAAANEFGPLFFSSNGTSGTGDAMGKHSVAPCAGTIRALYVNLDTAPGAGTSWTYSVYQNGGDVGSTVTISGTNKKGNVTGLALSVAIGDVLSVRVTTKTGAAASGLVSYAVVFEPTTAGEFICASTSSGAFAGDTFWKLCGAYEGDTQSTESPMQYPMPVALSFLGIAVQTTQAPSGGGSWTYKFRIAGSSGTISVVQSSGTKVTTRSVSVHDDFTAGQLCCIGSTKSGTTGTSIGGSDWAISMIPTTLLSRPRSLVTGMVG